ncbi:MAG: High-affinity branched-chain amino acid transport system permease protein LivH, partial [uncultured Acetobacteraceae bacterium]
ERARRGPRGRAVPRRGAVPGGRRAATRLRGAADPQPGLRQLLRDRRLPRRHRRRVRARRRPLAAARAAGPAGRRGGNRGARAADRADAALGLRPRRKLSAPPHLRPDPDAARLGPHGLGQQPAAGGRGLPGLRPAPTRQRSHPGLEPPRAGRGFGGGGGPGRVPARHQLRPVAARHGREPAHGRRPRGGHRQGLRGGVHAGHRARRHRRGAGRALGRRDTRNGGGTGGRGLRGGRHRRPRLHARCARRGGDRRRAPRRHLARLAGVGAAGDLRGRRRGAAAAAGRPVREACGV